MATTTYTETRFADMHPHLQEAIIKQLEARDPYRDYREVLAPQKKQPLNEPA